MKNFIFVILCIIINAPIFANSIHEYKKEWLHLNFDGIKKNGLSVEKNLSIAVDQSASPLFLPMYKKIKNITIEGNIKISRPIPDDPSWADQYFSLGIIYEGDLNPGFFARMVMPPWLLTLYKNADKKTKGIGNIEFWGVFKGSKIKSKSSSNFNLEIIKNYGTSLDAKNNFKLDIKPQNKKILALWFHADGDETKAKFLTDIHSIKIQ